MRIKPIMGLMRIRAKAGMTIPAAPRITSASVKPDVLKPLSMGGLCNIRHPRESRGSTWNDVMASAGVRSAAQTPQDQRKSDERGRPCGVGDRLQRRFLKRRAEDAVS